MPLQKVAIFLGNLSEIKFCQQPQKTAQMAKFNPIWSHWRHQVGEKKKTVFDKI